VKAIRFDVLPDDVLLDIFDFYMITSRSSYDKKLIEGWQTLVHVCRRWRSLVFGSPRRLDLRLVYSLEKRTRDLDTLDVWPALPIIVRCDMASTPGMDNTIAALEQNNRVCEVFLWGLVDWQLEQVSATMQVPFPELTELRLYSDGKSPRPPVIPDSFLGGSAPRLLHIDLDAIPFPGLPDLLLSATHLVHLWLTQIPHSGYFSPEAIVAPFSALSSLERFCLEFESPQSRPDRETRRPPPPKRFILPALEYFQFQGVTEYLEDFVNHIDTPQLDHLRIDFFDQINFDCRRLVQFINRTPKHRKSDEARLQFHDWSAGVFFGTLQILIECREPDRGISAVAQVCDSLHPISTVEDLYIDRGYLGLVWNNDAVENTLWLRLLLPFTAVKKLYLAKEFAPGIAAALQELVGDRITEVLPSLQKIFVEELEPFEEDIGRFVVARQLSGHPVTISNWNRDASM
jgi:hypothetical protein